ncbi:metalloregulator ArsR/SmtB family transcription factor [Actinotalea sp. K2]|uniref:helix-turn-helix transcriptional regulator n=1 Tax=Actinotalea sp. K2 TaxID=2939438 RepID=UPI0020170582|nr:helix-turn-helix domain-containing protein [Actinotalea sp. K2]MCL3862780.1 helix-turn-helix domain-containing protein [Actinotalea sp. K2]
MPVPRAEPTRRRPPGARRAALLELLRDHPTPLGVSDLAPMTGLHPNTVRTHLDALVRSGHVERASAPSGSRGRPRELYTATGAPTGDRNYELLAQVLATQLAALAADPGAQAVEAGRRWARDHPGPPGPPTPSQGEDPAGLREALAPVVGMLARTGFAPVLSPDARSISLRHCPFRELAQAHPQIVCGAHLGLIQGALDRIGPGVSATRLLPFVEPHLCVAELDHSSPPADAPRGGQ